MSISSLPPAQVHRISPGMSTTPVNGNSEPDKCHKSASLNECPAEPTALTRQLQTLKSMSDIDQVSVSEGMKLLSQQSNFPSDDIASALLNQDPVT